MALVNKTDLSAARASLREWLAARLPDAEGLAVSDVSCPSATGFSNETLFFEASWSEDGVTRREGMVARSQSS